MASLGPGAGVKNNQFGALMNRRKNLEKLVLRWDGVGTRSGSGMQLKLRNRNIYIPTAG